MTWSEEDLEAAVAAVALKLPNVSQTIIRVLVRTASREVDSGHGIGALAEGAIQITDQFKHVFRELSE
jgi:hypothetical protein